ncbi:hypothetical protein H0H92_011232 [Tricholoma furcatifolium]|nr:hypothetical protein H0H92_011232 [Tricholoma furcatifolium]
MSSVSPDTRSPDSPPATTPAGLAKLLADAYADAEALRRDLSATKKRAEHAERLNASLAALRQLPDAQDSAVDVLRQWEQRALAAEQARDDAEVKRMAIEASWIQLNQYLVQLEAAALDARAGFARFVENSGPVIITAAGPPPPPGRHRNRIFPPTLPLPPPPPATGSRRPRTPSIDGYGHPPAKKSRPDYDPNTVHSDRHGPPPPRMIVPPPDHKTSHLQPPRQRRPSRSRSRDSCRSDSSSTSVGDMIIQASEGQPNGNAPDPVQPPIARRKNRHEEQRSSHVSPPHFATTPLPHYENDQHVRRGYPSDYQNVAQDYRSSPKQATTGATAGEPLAQPGQAREFQTHIFAPVVTGAPVKKSKFPQGASNASTASIPPPPALSHPETQAQSTPPTVYPATNEQGQRICRQCGMAGRYKDGKCVEKWGPGPMGPGTVCDRCRKKMKRVERRGTLEQAAMSQNALGGSASLSHIQSSRTQSNPTIHRSDTLPALPQSHFNASSTRNDFQPSPRPMPQSSSANLNGTSRTSRGSPGPSITALRDDDDAPATSSVPPRPSIGSRSNSRNGTRPSSSGGHRASVSSGESRKPSSSSPLKHNNASTARRISRSPGSIMDVDAEGDAEEDADDVDAAFEGLVALGEEAANSRPAMEVDHDGAGDAEQELLEAVDAAEANSSASSNMGRLKEEE